MRGGHLQPSLERGCQGLHLAPVLKHVEHVQEPGGEEAQVADQEVEGVEALQRCHLVLRWWCVVCGANRRASLDAGR